MKTWRVKPRIYRCQPVEDEGDSMLDKEVAPTKPHEKRNSMICKEMYKQFSITGVWTLKQEVDGMRASSL